MCNACKTWKTSSAVINLDHATPNRAKNKKLAGAKWAQKPAISRAHNSIYKGYFTPGKPIHFRPFIGAPGHSIYNSPGSGSPSCGWCTPLKNLCSHKLKLISPRPWGWKFSNIWESFTTGIYIYIYDFTHRFPIFTKRPEVHLQRTAC